MSGGDIKIFPTAEELSEFAAAEFVRLSRESIAARGAFTVALSGGSTPKKLYARLASDDFRQKVEWEKAQIFFGDERCVPPGAEESNYRMTNENLLSKVRVPPENIHRFPTENAPAERAAAQMEAEIRRVFKLNSGEFPRFDLIFLGMGADGHTASLFPETEALQETEKIVAANYVEKLETFRLTLTYPAINNARNVIFLVAGADKAEVLKEVSESEKIKYPAQAIRPANGNLLFLLDKAAAARLA